ncbi:hypothetical protein Y1Q_0009516 [Alligator mississippiensis]|uniref:Uncharacterized protein n=1 Tax=Alligator mississippiensis TaxID=8496 RepID=A0A151NUQ2_ALLMI|nr:hypothetical protein Y1Q_0009516 [Alligator mississippiensis]
MTQVTGNEIFLQPHFISGERTLSNDVSFYDRLKKLWPYSSRKLKKWLLSENLFTKWQTLIQHWRCQVFVQAQ